MVFVLCFGGLKQSMVSSTTSLTHFPIHNRKVLPTSLFFNQLTSKLRNQQVFNPWIHTRRRNRAFVWQVFSRGCRTQLRGGKTYMVQKKLDSAWREFSPPTDLLRTAWMFINDYHAIMWKKEVVEDFRTTQVPHGPIRWSPPPPQFF